MSTEVETVVAGEGGESGKGSNGNDVAGNFKESAPISDAEAAKKAGFKEVPAAAEYMPNFKYKVHGQEKEFSDWAKSAIKDGETERQVRELYTRADGIEHIKQDRERLASEIQTVQQEKMEFDKSLKELSHFVQSDDLQSFFDALKIPKEQVLRYALREVQFADNPSLRQQYEQQRQANIQTYQQQNHGQSLQMQYEQAAVGLRERELDFSIGLPETKSVAEVFDSRVGRPGAFRDEVINRGRFHFLTNKIDMPVDQVVKEVIQIFGLSQAQAPNVQNMGGPTGVVQGSKGKPVIPNIPGSGQSAVKKTIKGIAGLKERHAELVAREG